MSDRRAALLEQLTAAIASAEPADVAGALLELGASIHLEAEIRSRTWKRLSDAAQAVRREQPNPETDFAGYRAFEPKVRRAERADERAWTALEEAWARRDAVLREGL